MPNTRQITKEGLEKLKEELQHLKAEERPSVVRRMAAARELGDLSENADYHDAREQLAFLEGRIQELESMIKTAEVVSSKAGSSTVQMGSHVTIDMGGKHLTYTIVGAMEGDPSGGKLSVESPVAAALIGHKEGDSVTVNTPGGQASYTISKVA